MKLRPIVLLSLLALPAAGCKQFDLGPFAVKEVPVERMAVESFNDAVAGHHLDKIRNASSERFGRYALRRDDALEALDQIRLPHGEVFVTKVDDVSSNEKRVSVEIGEHHLKLLYQLTKPAESETWVVDDIFIKQRHGGVIATRSVTEQMDLLLTVREFMDAARADDREAILASMTGGFRGVMKSVPDKTFDRLAAKMAGKESASKMQKPDAQLDGDQAVVSMHRLSGKLVMTLRIEDGTWKVDNVAVESLEDNYHIPNMRKTVAAMKVGADFLKAYQSVDREELRRLSTSKFFEGSLEHGDFSAFALPIDDLLKNDFEVRAQGRVATILIPSGNRTVTIDLRRKEFTDDPDQPEEYRVEEVTMFEGRQQKEMSAVFTSRARLLVFCEALRNGQLDVVKQISTPDFSKRIWSNVDESTLRTLPLEDIRRAGPEILSTEYLGEATEFSVRHGERLVTYRLRDWNGEQLVDDIRDPIPGEPESLKDRLEVLIPTQKFLQGLQSADLKRVREATTTNFNLLVWRHLDEVPPSGRVVASACSGEPNRIDRDDESAEIGFTQGERSAVLRLRKDKDRWAIDDVELSTGGPSPQVADFRETLRLQIASGALRSTSMAVADPPVSSQPTSQSAIQQVGYTQDAAVAPAPMRHSAGAAAPPRTLTPQQTQTPALQLDQMPPIDVDSPITERPRAPIGPVSERKTYTPPEVIQANGESPYRKRTKRLSPMSPIWNQ